MSLNGFHAIHHSASFVIPRLGRNSSTRTPATDTTNGRAHNNSTTCCTTKSPPTDKNLPHPSILTSSRCWALALRCGKFVVELLWACPLVVSVSESTCPYSRCPCSGVWALRNKMRERGWSKQSHVGVIKCNAELTAPVRVTMENVNRLTVCWPLTFSRQNFCQPYYISTHLLAITRLRNLWLSS